MRVSYTVGRPKVATSKQEAQWVLRAQCNDREALESLLRSVQPALHQYLSGLVGRFDADDVLQEVLVVIYRKLAWLRAPELFRHWAYRIASRAAFRHLNKERRRPERVQDESVSLEQLPVPAGRPSAETLEGLLNVDCIPPATRAVLVLHFQQELTLPEVAAVLAIPLGTVKSRLASGLAALRNQSSERRSL
jgi:RNA polymerase sigma-70 factor (ECF subfamily)